jgi:UDP-4-amino-4,6-dideoxy-N-acetyl-beta-L-altrosamine transaminase
MGEKLAIEGGNPVRKTYLPYGHQWIDESDIKAVVEVLHSDWVTTGPKVAEFETRLADYVGAKYAIVFSSGTAALHAAVFAAGIGPGDEVITTPMTFAASANCVLYQGGKPVFADVQPDTLNINPLEIEKKITPRTKAIIPVDYTGQPCDLEEIKGIAQKHGLIMIEDAAHALGATYRGQRVGSLSDMTIFSFHPVKLITTGEGGAVVTDDFALAQRLRIFRNHGITTEAREREEAGDWFYEMVYLGYNYRLTDIQCALGLSQMNKLDSWLARRQEIARRYDEAFAELPEIMTPVVKDDRSPAWHLYVIRLNLERLWVRRAEVFAALRAENIGVNVHYIPVHLHPYYRKRFGYKRGDYPVAESAYEQLISLPIFPKMTDNDVSDVINAVTKVVRHYRC